MGDTTKIEWTHHTFNPWLGCQRVSPGCEHCYAEAMSKRTGLVQWGPSAPRRVTSDAYWRGPRRWNAAAEKAGERRRVFCASMADVFEDRKELISWRSHLWDLIDATPWLDWQLLTKRPENVRGLVPWGDSRPANVWLGVSVEDQRRAEERIPHLLAAPARVRFLSCEPLLGSVNLRSWLEVWASAKAGASQIDWVIVGGESGPGARSMHVAWAREIRDACAEAGVACFVKQLGAKPVVTLNAEGRPWLKVLRDAKGGDWDEWPADLRVREFPEARHG